jgi:DNA-binding NtrC family response regulator
LHNLLEQACAMTERIRLTRPDLLALLPAPGARTGPGAPASIDPGPADRAGAASPSGPAEGLPSPAPPGSTPGAGAADRRPLPERVAELERAAIAEALQATGGNRRDAARRLGISRATLYERLKAFALG